MWGSVLVLALGANLNPVRLGLALLVISRPRPVQNLLAYWVGCLLGSIQAMAIPLTLLHGAPIFESVAHYLATSSTIGQIRIGLGLLALSIAALMTVQSLTRRRQKAHLPTPGDNTPTLALDSHIPPVISRLLRRPQDAPTKGGSAFGRLLRRAHNAWDNGSLWVAFLIGSFAGGPEPDVFVFLIAFVAASGAAIGTQITAIIVYAVVMLALIEIILVSCVVSPAKTQARVQRLHDWALVHRRKVVVAMCAVGGVALVATGMASV